MAFTVAVLLFLKSSAARPVAKRQCHLIFSGKIWNATIPLPMVLCRSFLESVQSQVSILEVSIKSKL